jgi:benzoate transport
MNDITDHVHQRLNSFQIITVLICVLINMIDGFDLLVMAFTASEVAKEWGLTSTEMGIALSGGLLGVGLGSLFLAPLADTFGRRKIILWSLGINTAGMLLSAAAQDITQLTLLRVITGIGIGGALPSVVVLAGEYVPLKWRNTAVSLVVIGVPIGATVGGALIAPFIVEYGWRSAFIFGGVSSLVTVAILMYRLPESIQFLCSGKVPNSLQRINALRGRMKLPDLAELPVPDSSSLSSSGMLVIRELFSARILPITILIWLAFFLLMFSTYFVISWTPKLLVSEGLSTQQGITGGVLMNLGGIIGGGLFAFIALKTNLNKLTGIFLSAFGLSMITFGFYMSTYETALIIAMLIGFFMNGAMCGLYALPLTFYPPEIRVTGVGWGLGIGRIGAILSPTTVGFLIDKGWSSSSLYYLVSTPLFIATATVLFLVYLAKRKEVG